MCASSRLLPVNIKWYVIHQLDDDILDDEIIDNAKTKFLHTIHASTSQRLWDRYQATHDVVNNWHEGRPQLYNTEETTKIVLTVRRKKTLTAADIYKWEQI